ncbi:MAG TPA: DUF3175 domain-containing protein [Steroidobacteraceae bacterium]|nr:DUF3175 domain-containing protein [Steroidobacteraceae bacterium]
MTASRRKASPQRKKTQPRTSSRPTRSSRPSAGRHRWSARVTRESDALDLERSVFTSGSAKHIARSLKHSAEASQRRKGSPYQSAMSMLNFFINRAGENLTRERRAVLERAKSELRREFGRA